MQETDSEGASDMSEEEDGLSEGDDQVKIPTRAAVVLPFCLV